jgi:hypothetical protein
VGVYEHKYRHPTISVCLRKSGCPNLCKNFGRAYALNMKYLSNLQQPRTITSTLFFFFLISWCVMRLGPPGTSATNWPIIPTPSGRWVGSSWCNENWQVKPKNSEKTFLSATIFTPNPTLPELGSNPGRHGGKPAANLLSYGASYNKSLRNP